MGNMVHLEMEPTQKIMLKRHLGPDGQASRYLAQEIKRLSDPYVPFDTGTLKNSAYIESRGKSARLIYATPYARYHWYGKVMVGPAPKKVTNINMRYYGAPKRGPFWARRMWADRGDEIVESVARYTGGRKK